MKHILPFLALAFASPALAAPETYTFDPTHMHIVWQVNHFGLSNPTGKFNNVTGTLTLDEANPSLSKVDVKIAPANVLSGVDKLDEHLRGKDFLNTEKFPAATFVSDKVEVTGKDTAKVTGTLTLLGIAKPLTLDMKLNKIGEHPMSKKKAVGFSGSTMLKRSDFGVSYGIPAISDEVKLTIEAEASLP